ncbi:MAG: pre-16S rRNA-processing nuclease YqgF [Succiniclasticum sp.]|jgi:hypothetical protein|nr:pre-16S rRNA-processing nuclease YqgF [Succiniclasticum sp.]
MKNDTVKESLYLGIDPGRGKTGAALVRADGSLRSQCVLRTAGLRKDLPAWLERELGVRNIWGLRAVLAGGVIGNGTYSAPVRKLLQELLPGVSWHEIGEAHSTEEARRLYWKLHPPRGWRRLVPLGLQVPPDPLDGYAAVVQVRRYLASLSRGE